MSKIPTITVNASSWARVTRERDEARADCERLNQLLRNETALGQGEIDHWAALEAERDEAREAFAIATNNCVGVQQQLRAARDRAWKLGRERNHWKSESLEQAKLLAISADREEKMRDALKYIAGLDTSQGTSPQQCSAVAVAMEALQ